MAEIEDILPVELVDYFFFLYLTAIVSLLLFLAGKASPALWHLGIHTGFFAMGALILCMNARRSKGFVFFCRIWYIPFLYFFLFEEVGQMIHLFRPAMFDPWVIGLEVKTFAGYPMVWLQGLASPWLTELMSLFYMTYYFLIPLLGLTLYFQKEFKRLNDFILATSVTFFFCFLHYLAMPVAGPIFIPDTLPYELVPLHGGPFTAFEQWLFFKGAIQGGAFPSSHVAVAVVVLFFGIRYGRYPHVFAVTVTGLAISTVYNGYHYGVDVLYGILMGLIFSLLCPFLNDLWRSRTVRRSQ